MSSPISTNPTNGPEAKGASTPSTSNGPQPMPTTPNLVEFLPFLEDYSPTLPDSVASCYLHNAGFSTADPRVVRLISLSAQKFLSDIVNDALQHCKVRSSNQSSKSKSKDRTFTLTMEDLTPALSEHGISIYKPPYYV